MLFAPASMCFSRNEEIVVWQRSGILRVHRQGQDDEELSGPFSVLRGLYLEDCRGKKSRSVLTLSRAERARWAEMAMAQVMKHVFFMTTLVLIITTEV